MISASGYRNHRLVWGLIDQLTCPFFFFYFFLKILDFAAEYELHPVKKLDHRAGSLTNKS